MTNVNMIVEVVAIVPFDQLSHKDLANDGNCAVDGSYRMTIDDEDIPDPELIEMALDHFHSNIPIGTLDHFLITCRPEVSNDRISGDAWLRKDLGKIPQ